ncbi:ATP-dependent DNA helicase PcrA [Candidatus Berkelbacteria bacterium CG10_big_fil_rev_8_21_14_0_10_41_12]|uniref:DNA 3'-5' helicase n=1 Tax=Candidatus Berkelbacteria bacterium CG10_big_fil_rev_8_21_14_0_10_41_12 TaxID=1974513 RepID=A0A2M6WX85_9BACT|nr:MAG: ATP-dependent DNA helicase PcrA [Candidatus Berkelbacteria bacterium CG10_big_fil_rev_8_21_14_0_10_41_12]
MIMDLFKDLNASQQEAVRTTKGPVLILAGAGSGKTRALTYRIAYLVSEKRIHPASILAVTFTNKAAGEIKARVKKLFSKSNMNFKVALNFPWMGTFHSICVKILRREAHIIGCPSNFTIFDEDDSIRAVKRAMDELSISPKQYNPNAIRYYISSAKCELVNSKDYESFAIDHFTKIVSKVYKSYQSILRSSEALDFDDLISKTVELFTKNPQILRAYQERFKYILVDEYQDTNEAQYRLIKLLSDLHRNIFVIGDDWQSIYAFRGAKFKNILDFNRDYPEAKVIKLEENYRSTQSILNAAQSIIKNNKVRSDKNLYSKGQVGAPVTVVELEDNKEEVEFIVDEMRALMKGEGYNYNSFVILYRTNAQSRIFEEYFLRFKIPYRVIGGVRFYQRKEVKDVVAYLRLLQNSNDSISLARVINVPPRKIGKKTLEKILSGAHDKIPKYEDFLNLIADLRKDKDILAVDLLIDRVMDKSDYRKFLDDGTEQSATRLENIEELKTVAKEHPTLEAFLEAVSLMTDIDQADFNKPAVTLMTLHSAKGLEYPIVFIVGMEEGLFPHSRALMDETELEEERRLCYVGMTRAMHRLYLSLGRMRIMYGKAQYSQPSRFLEELEKDEIDWIN